MADFTLMRYDVTDLNNGLIQDFPVSNPPGWDDITMYYAYALLNMGWQQSQDGDTDVSSMWAYSDAPDQYYFQAAMHWWPQYPDTLPPSPYDQRWSHCTHGPASSEQYFLPWHRLYIYFYEMILRGQVASIGGPELWSLPYWNYSAYDGSNPSAPWVRSNLPWCFQQPTLPGGEVNPLYISDTAKRGLQPMWPGTQDTMFLSPTTPFYDGAYANADYDGFNSTLDGAPHGAVHVDVGTGDGQVSSTGWMMNTVTASFDPIFWLHHAEIDRFWVGWNANGGPNRTDDVWLNAEDDPLRATRWNFWADSDINNVWVCYPGSMVDPLNLGGNFPYNYQYEDLPAVPAPEPSGVGAIVESRGAALEANAPSGDGRELASADAPVELGKEATSTTVALPDEAPSILEGSPHVTLYLEDVVATGVPGNYEVYLNYPDADQSTSGSVPHYCGLLSGFGADHHHEGHEHGVSASYDITDLVAYLRAQGEWDESQATVTFVPAGPPRPGLEVVSQMRVGKVRFETS
jgi:tyrosinase